MWGGESPNRIDTELGNSYVGGGGGGVKVQIVSILNWGTVMWGGESPNRIDTELGNSYVGW